MTERNTFDENVNSISDEHTAEENDESDLEFQDF